MRGAADVLLVAAVPRAAPGRRGCIGKVQAVVNGHEGLLTREVVKIVEDEPARVSNVLNKLKNDGLIRQEFVRPGLCRWFPAAVPPAAPAAESPAPAPVEMKLRVDAVCGCGTWILFGALASEEERADPTCSECLGALAALRRLGR